LSAFNIEQPLLHRDTIQQPDLIYSTFYCFVLLVDNCGVLGISNNNDSYEISFFLRIVSVVASTVQLVYEET